MSCPVGTRRSGYCQELGPCAVLSLLRLLAGLYFSVETFLKVGLTSTSLTSHFSLLYPYTSGHGQKTTNQSTGHWDWATPPGHTGTRHGLAVATWPWPPRHSPFSPLGPQFRILSYVILGLSLFLHTIWTLFNRPISSCTYLIPNLIPYMVQVKVTSNLITSKLLNQLVRGRGDTHILL